MTDALVYLVIFGLIGICVVAVVSEIIGQKRQIRREFREAETIEQRAREAGP